MPDSELQLFQFNTSPVRTMTIDGEPWFVAKDISDVLEFTDPTHALRGLEESEKGLHIVETLGGEQSMTIVSESGMYALVLRSRKSQAKPFRLWVTSEVLPSIRKTGVYGVTTLPARIPTTRLGLLELAVEQEKKIEEQHAKLLSNNHKVQFYDQVTGSQETMDVETVAKTLNIPGVGRTKLFQFLRVAGVIEYSNRPYQKYVDCGYAKLIERPWINPRSGRTQIYSKTVFYQKGVEFIGKLLKEQV